MNVSQLVTLDGARLDAIMGQRPLAKLRDLADGLRLVPALRPGCPA